MAIDYEKLGVFYLGRELDPATGKLAAEPLLYDSRDLTTHAVCRRHDRQRQDRACASTCSRRRRSTACPQSASIRRATSATSLLTFPRSSPRDFEPWMDAGDAARKGITVAELATQTAQKWRDGLAEWDQAPSASRGCATLPTSRSTRPAAMPACRCRCCSRCPRRRPRCSQDEAALAERVTGVTSGLLTLIGRDADPLTSRDHILVASLLGQAWRSGTGIDLAQLVALVQKPPMSKLGALDLDTFFPPKDRLCARPVDQRAARESELHRVDPWRAARHPAAAVHAGRQAARRHRLDRASRRRRAHVRRHAAAAPRCCPGCGASRARRRCARCSTWTRCSATSRRAPMPPSKPPMLTLLKQARAFGLGVVLATQNPVDLDYKGLGNAGTWFIGRLQTERDRERVLDGLDQRARRRRHRSRRTRAAARCADATRVPDALAAGRDAGADEEPLGPVVPARTTDAERDCAGDGEPQDRGCGSRRAAARPVAAGRSGRERARDRRSARVARGSRRAVPRRERQRRGSVPAAGRRPREAALRRCDPEGRHMAGARAHGAARR